MRPLVAAAVIALGAGCAGDPPPPPPVKASVAAPSSTAIVALGTGAMTALAEALASAYRGEPAVRVEASVGSSGGVRAAADGAVDLGMVSRPLNQGERAQGLVEVKVATAAVALAAGPTLGAAGVTSRELVDLCSGIHSTVGAEQATLLLRDRDESANIAIERLVPGLREAREEAYRARRFRVIYHEAAMREALVSTERSLGLLDLAAITPPLRALALDGVTPSVEAMREGRWRATRDLSFVYRSDREARVEPFLRFVRGPEGRRIIEQQRAIAHGSEAP